MNTIIIGAGPAGLTAAYQLSKTTSEVTVFEADSQVGGLARSIKLWDQTVDLGPHRFFSQDRRVNEIWLEVVGRDYAMISRQTRILYQQKLFQYPLQPLDALAKLGLLEAVHCVGSYALERLRPTPLDGSFESWVCKRFGRHLFEIFFKSYSEKLWGISCKVLDADFAAQRIKSFSLSAALQTMLAGGRGNKHRTLVDEFGYPTGGSGMVFERMAAAVRAAGGNVRLKTPVRKILTEGRKVTGVELFNGRVESCDQVISTMPLTVMVSQLDKVPDQVLDACRQLQFRNTILVYLEVTGDNPFTDNWIYVHSKDLLFGRVTNFRNWVPQLCGTSPNTILALEYWCNGTDEIWGRDDQLLAAQAREEIVKSGLVASVERLGRSQVLRIPRCYPIYQRGYQEHVRVIKEHLETISGLQVIGRYGSFKYNNQDHSILMGHLAAENVLRGMAHDLWRVNADYEVYQEACTLTETGLVNAK